MREPLPGNRSGVATRRLRVWAAFLACLLLCAPVPAQAAARDGGIAEAGRPSLAEAAHPLDAILAGWAAKADLGRAGEARGGAPVLLAAASPRPSQAGGSETAPTEAAAPASGPSGSSGVSGEAPARKKSIRLFNTVEFRGALKNMPKWQRVVAAEQKSRTFDGDLSKVMRPASVYKQWLQLVERVKNASDMEKAKVVTAFFNRWPYKTDDAIYKVADYWATPKEFLRNSGDCEDYAITKFYALMKLGVDPENMRIVALRDTIRNLAHAVLVVYMNDDAYVLDNLTTMVLPHTRYQHYAPQYSVNEVYRWAHVRPKKKR